MKIGVVMNAMARGKNVDSVYQKLDFINTFVLIFFFSTVLSIFYYKTQYNTGNIINGLQ